MTVKISDEHLALAREQAAKDGYADVGAYLESLIGRVRNEAEERAETVAAVREAQADVEAGREQPLDEAMRDIARKYNLPPVNGRGL
jgi:hypothetical protein